MGRVVWERRMQIKREMTVAASQGTNRLLFFDPLRNFAMLSVILYHAVAAYSTVTPHWAVHDGTSVIADGIRHLYDVFMMPIFFFVSGYFAVPSLATQGTWRFLGRKFRRIGTPWLVAVFIIVPLMRFLDYVKAASGGPSESFAQYWITYLKGIGTFQVALWTPERVSQMHFWFLSLLLLFFIGFVAIYRIMNGRGERPECGRSMKPPASHGSILVSLFSATIVTALAYFSVILVVPDMSWATIDLLLQFQPAGLVVYVASFAVGCLAYTRQWFANKDFLRRFSVWFPLVVLLTAGFFIIGHDVFAHPLTSQELAPGLLLAFSFTRTVLCLAILMALIAYVRSRKGQPSALTWRLADSSYYIYLVHIFFVVFVQHVLMIWPAGPPMAKVGITFFVVLPISYGISRLMACFPRAFVAGFVALFVVVILFG
jgi:glucans biosynthesis protein C